MTDRELLELAAKAAGIDAAWHCPAEEVELWADQLAATEGLWLRGERSPDNSKYWNPLTDLGDTMRLAIQLDMRVSRRQAEAKYNQQAYSIRVEIGDEIEDTCRAVVMVAADIGKVMK